MQTVELSIGERELFVGSFTKLTVTIDPRSGLALEDLDFHVVTGLAGGVVSLSRDAAFDPLKPVLMLLAGHEPGSHELRVHNRADGSVVGALKYEIVGTWTVEEQGPALWFGGQQDAKLTGAAWGGGPSGPQNIATAPALGTRSIAVLFVDTTSQRYSTDAATMQGHRDRWLNEIVNGVAVNGQIRSTAAFYREVSYGQFDLTAQAFGPVSLPSDHDTYFNADGSPKGSFFQAAITAADALIDYRNFATVVFVTPTVPASGMQPAKAAWPYASIGHWGPYTTAEGKINLGWVSMSNEWGTTNDREIHETFAHELGHNLGLGDQYTPGVANRNPGGWDLMDSDNPFPHVSVAHRMMLGWVPANWVRTFNFAASAAPVDTTVRLHPIEQGVPPAARASAVEVRIGDGLNYYFEYRNGENPQIGDRSLPTDDRVLGTDVASPPYIAPFARPTVLLLPADGDDSGPVLGNSDFYREIDASPTPVEFRVDVSGLDGAKADLRVRYGTNGRPDPSIRPWPASPSRPWQSPDIEVRNARSMAGAQWFNVPWVGNQNTVVAKVTNKGNVMAPAVRVNFYVKNFNIGGAPEAFLGADVRDIPAGGTVEFTTSWVPPATGHYCVIVRIPLYVVPTAPTIVEMTELNNIAQSNYDRFVSTTGSPSTREQTVIEVGNPYDRPTRVWIIGQQNNPLYRTYLDTTWLLLDAGETRPVKVMFELTLDPKSDTVPADVQPYRELLREFVRQPNRLGLHAYAEQPHDNPRHSLELLGGADVQVATGREVHFDRFDREGRIVTGTVVTTDDGAPVPGGRVLTTFTVDVRAPHEYLTVTSAVKEGRFEARVPRTWRFARAEYLPEPGFGPAVTDWIGSGH